MPKFATILLVDDDDDAREAFGLIFEHEGYRVLTAATGEEAYRIVNRNVPNLVLLDIRLPDADGIELCSRIKASRALADVVVLLYSGYSTSADYQILGLRAGADGYVAKPVSPAQLLAHVEALLRLKNAEAVLGEPERQLRAIFETALDAMLVADDERRYVHANPAACQLFRLSYGNLVGRRIDDFLRPADRRRLDEIWPAFLEEGTFAGELHLLLSGDTRRIVDVRASANMLPGRHLSILRDVTERKREEEATLRLASIVRTSQDAMYTKALDGTVLSWNPAAERIYGYTAQEMIGRPVSILVPARLAQEPNHILERVIRKEEIPNFETKRRRKDGVEIDVSLTISSLRDETGAVVGASIVGRDISDRAAARAALEQSEKLLRTVVDALPVGVWLTDAEGAVVLDNPAGRVIWAGEHCVGDGGPEAYTARHCDTGEPVGPDPWSARQVRETGEAVLNDVLEIECLDGTRKMISNSAVPTRDASGAVVGAVVVSEDITLRRATETALALRLRGQAALAEVGRLALSLTDLPEVLELAVLSVATTLKVEYSGIVEIDASGDFFHFRYGTGWPAGMINTQRVPAGTMSQAGYTVLEGCPVVAVDLAAERRFGNSQLLVEEGIRSGLSAPIHWRGRPYGVLTAHSKSTRHFGQEEVDFLAGMAKILAEAIERCEIDRQLREREERLRMVLDQMPLACMLIDADDCFSYWNPAAERLFGYSFEEVRGRHPLDTIVAPEARSLVEEVFRKFASGGPSVLANGTNLTKDGRMILCEWSTIRLEDAEHAYVGLLSVAQDITNRRAMEEQLLQSQKMESVGRLAAGIAHDFNNLLTVIGGYSDMVLARVAVSDSIHEDVAEIRTAADRATDLTRQLLAFSRRQILNPQVIDLNVTVDASGRMLRRLIGEDVELSVVTSPDIAFVKVDPGQMEQVILNLAVNARDAMPDGGTLTIGTANVLLDERYVATHPYLSAGPHVTLTMTDTGCGIDRELRSKIFEPFFTTKETGKGTGLGLSTVYGIVQQSGGYIEVDSEVGVGTTFRIYLPSAEEGPAERRDASEASDGPRGCETILIVEDEEAVRRLAVAVLQMSGYNVLDAEGGEQALEVAARYEEPVHLILTDVVMPRMSGRQVADRLTALHPESRVLFMSGYTENAIVHHGVLDHDIAFIAKPFTPGALVARVREALDAPEAPDGDGA